MDNVFQRVYEITARIPYGRVTTYGQIARLLGNPRLSRIVGCAAEWGAGGLALPPGGQPPWGTERRFLPSGKGESAPAAGDGGGALPAGWRGGPDGLYVVRRRGIETWCRGSPTGTLTVQYRKATGVHAVSLTGSVSPKKLDEKSKRGDTESWIVCFLRDD